ncbi:xanthine dehydrogenase family protein molybdopterin-binding subunit [Foetidibacter luteolus]|uniref:xanthine dehydrogenase family protein molybdopterin-binding subunit n=1 Tax=Foetidibacter luteolus TaxID=2608880 RepID=UPI00129ACFA0|nr:xanthine dehydrogenase family protein molybdopterin-binding subunit [Foetidibacter luteolus]
MNDNTTVNRRKFLQTGALAGGGLLLSFYMPALGKGLKRVPPAPATCAPNAFIRINADNSIKILCGHSEMGQGTYTAMSQLIADEMDADWSKIVVEAAPAHQDYFNPGFGMQLTGGSASAYSEWERLRKVGASARAIMIEAAAKKWNVPAAGCTAKDGFVLHSSGKKISYGDLVEAAQGITPPTDVKLKDPKDFKYIGKPVKRLDTKEKTNGEGIFGMDVKIPGMLVAVIQRPPVFGGKVKSFNADKAKAVPGVQQVVQIDRGVAVVATGYWAAKQGREALEVEWEDGPLLDSVEQRKLYKEMANKPGSVALKEGDVSAVTGAAKALDVEYETPYLNHAQMEPLNCVADVRADGCDIYIGTQAQTIDQMVAAGITGLKPEQVKIHTMLLGGAFGRRAIMDGHIAAEAVQVSKAIAKPVKVMWSREDDVRGGYYRQFSHHKMIGSLGADGKPLSWLHRVVCQSFMIGTPMEQMAVKNGVDMIAVEGATELPYEVPNLQIEWHRGTEAVPTLWMRSVGHSYTAFAKECFIDELAFAAGKDPYQYRRSLMDKHPRLRNVLDVAAKKAGWGTALPAGRARGIAVHESFKSFIAQVAEVSVTATGKIKVHKVVCAIDCGPTINPDTIKAQMEGSVVFALTSAFYGDISFENGRVKQRNFHDYKIMRINEAPVVETHIIESTDTMGGVGEPGVPPTAPAVANAVFVLTKNRLRKMPFPADVRKTT